MYGGFALLAHSLLSITSTLVSEATFSGTNYAPLLAGLFLHPFEYDLMHNTMKQDMTKAIQLRWLDTVVAVSEYTSFGKLWQEKGCSSQAETWQVENILMKDFDSQVKFDIFVVSMAT